MSGRLGVQDLEILVKVNLDCRPIRLVDSYAVGDGTLAGLLVDLACRAAGHCSCCSGPRLVGRGPGHLVVVAADRFGDPHPGSGE